MRPGWGRRHPALADILRSATAVAVGETHWLDGALRLRVSAHAPLIPLPDELVVSVRCLVAVDHGLVVCTNRDGTHPWPGGRREAGETFAETARREVHEETGWLVEPDSLRALGWLHFEHLTRPPDDHPYPHPDFLQAVLTGRASERDRRGDADWTDTDGYELTSRLVPIRHVPAMLSGDPTSRLALAFLDRL